MKFNYLNLLYSTFYSDLCSVHMYVCVVYVLCMYVYNIYRSTSVYLHLLLVRFSREP